MLYWASRVTCHERRNFCIYLERSCITIRARPEHLRGQYYDGCSTMMGKKSGGATTLKNELNKNAWAIHYHAHALNVACGDSIKTVN